MIYTTNALAVPWLRGHGRALYALLHFDVKKRRFTTNALFTLFAPFCIGMDRFSCCYRRDAV